MCSKFSIFLATYFTFGFLFDKSPDLRYVPPHLFSLYIPLSGTLSNGMSHHVSIRFHNYVLQVLHTLDHILHIRLSSDKLPDLHCVQLSLFSLCTLLSGTLSNVMFHHVSTHFRNYVLQVLRIPGYTLHIRLSFDRLPDLHCVRLHLSFLAQSFIIHSFQCVFSSCFHAILKRCSPCTINVTF